MSRHSIKSDACVSLLKALSNESRWTLLCEIVRRPSLVCELTDRTGFSQYNVSKHLAILRRAGVVQAEHQGNKYVLYRIADGVRQTTAGHVVLNFGCCSFRFDG
jgi:DNA-binding transcriptional ArsR family regulator